MVDRKPEIGFMNQLTTDDILDDIRFAIDNDFQWFEIGMDWKQNFNLSDKKLEKIKELAEDNDIKLIIHSAWYLPTSSVLPGIKEGVFKHIEKAVKLAEKVGSNRITVHPGYREMPGPAIDLSYQSLISNLKKIVKIADKKDINICFENIDKMESLLCYSEEDYMRVLNSVDKLKTTLDIGHANTTDTSVTDYLGSVKDTIMDMHVHDNSGEKDEHKCIGEGSIDFHSLFKKCREIGYYGPFTLEIFPYENILKGRKRFLELWEESLEKD